MLKFESILDRLHIVEEDKKVEYSFDLLSSGKLVNGEKYTSVAGNAILLSESAPKLP